MPAIPRPRPPTSSTAGTSPRVRPGYRSPSTCRPRPATIPITRWRAAKSAKWACRSPISATCGACSRASRLTEMNTSMTINATAAWLLALYVALAEEQGRRPRQAHRHGAERHPQGVSVARHLHLPAGPVAAADQGRDRLHQPRDAEMEPDQCLLLSFAGGGRDAGAGARLRAGHRRGGARRGAGAPARCRRTDFPHVVGSISFFVNAGVRLHHRSRKMRAFVDLWDEIAEKRYGVEDPTLRRFRYGVQVNSLGLTEQQPENNVYRILLSMLAVTLSKKARARAVQLPAWNEALGLPRPWDQQWSLRLQQIVAYETDLLEYGDIFDGSVEIDRKVEELKGQARAELAKLPVKRRGGGGHRLHERGADRVERRARRGNREGRAGAGRRQCLYRDRAFAAFSQRHRRHPDRAGVGRDRTGRGASSLAAEARREGGAAGAGRAQIGRGRRTQHHAAVDRRRQSRRHHRRMGPGPARGVRRISRADRHPRQAPRSTRHGSKTCAAWSRRPPASSAGRSPSWSASPGSTAIPTAPSRSPCAPPMSAWTWSMTASG